MSRLYDLLARNLHCCGCGCFIPLAGIAVLASTGLIAVGVMS
jgi:hypothetical protein